MATASVEIGGIDFKNYSGSSINGPCLYQEALTIGGSAATMANAVTPAQVTACNNACIARVAVDTDAYVAKGSAPDPTATAASNATTARRLVSAGSAIELAIAAGEKIAVKSLS
ncbi:hypothetical protein [Bradyrhizobium sp.]|uniref:hypothetical protein n=1 Tax=Bradyrhizobium sp. TaxID=376 RepID=UPI0039E54240